MDHSKNLCKHWVFTINNPLQADQDQVAALTRSTEYYIAANEVGESGTPHIQGYLCLLKKRRRTAVSKLLPRARLDVMRGTPLEASDYCKKGGDFHEEGTLPIGAGLANKRNWEAIRSAAKEGRFDDIDAGVYVQHYQNLKRIRADHPPVLSQIDTLNNFLWYYGPPGTGKSKKAHEDQPRAYTKDPSHDWWDGYQDEPFCIVDDLDKFHVARAPLIKKLCDHYPFQASIKGSLQLIRPVGCIVTSNYTPEEIWDDPITVEAVRRRFKFHHFNKPLV